MGRVSSEYCVSFFSCVLGEVRPVTGLGFLLGGCGRCGVDSALESVCFVGLRLGAAFGVLFG